MAAGRLPKSRASKRPMATADYSTGGGTLTVTKEPARMPRLEPKGYSAYVGAPHPTLVDVSEVA